MHPTSTPNPPGRAVGCDIVARASVCVSAGGLAGLRRAPGTFGGAAFPAARLKHADEQTIVGLAAVLQAVESGGLDPAGFGAWAVLAAPRFLGRSAFEAVFPQYLAEGAWGVSPHVVSSHSLHAVSGMISQVLKAHGLNLGIGGAPGEEVEAFLTAASLLDSGATPGVWVVMTGCDHEDAETPFQALALALTCHRDGWAGPRLSVRPGRVVVEQPGPAGVEPRPLWRADPGHGPTPANPQREARPARRASGIADTDGEPT